MTAETHPIDKELVMTYLDGELAPEQASRVAMHLEQCAECRELAGELRGVSSQLLAWNVETAPERLNDAVLEALNKRDTNGGIRISRQDISRWFTWKNLSRSRWVWAAAGTFTVVVCVIALAPRTRYMREAIPPRYSSTESLSTGLGNYSLTNNLEKERARVATNLVPAETQSPSGPMIARTASLNISVKDFNAARSSMDRIVRGHLGYVSSLNISTEKGAPQSLTGKLMIPAAQLDAALAELKALGRVEQEQQGGEEVTSQVVDLDARLKNARETETQMSEILRTRAGKVGDVLEVEKEMARVRGEIESMGAEQKQLRDRIAFASVDLSMVEEYQAQFGDGPSLVGRKIRNALLDGYHSAMDGFLSVCIFLLSIVPNLLLWGFIFFWPARWAWRRWQKGRA